MALCDSIRTSTMGHCGFYGQNYSDGVYLKDDGTSHSDTYLDLIVESMFQKSSEIHELFKFLAIQVKPHLTVLRDAVGFTVFGPHYSVAAEAARFRNYSMDGQHNYDEDTIHMSLKYKPDFLITNLPPLLSFFSMIIDSNKAAEVFGISPEVLKGQDVGGVTRSVAEIEIDVIMCAKLYKSTNPLRFLYACDENIYYLCGALSLIISLLLSRDDIKKFFYYLENLLYAAVMTPSLEIKRWSLNGLLTIWIMTLWIITAYFGGDMISEMVMAPEADVIDSFEKLHQSPNRTIYFLSTETAGQRNASKVKNEYFRFYPEYHDDFASRAVAVDYNKEVQLLADAERFARKLISPEGRKSTVFMTFKSWALFMQNKLGEGKYKEMIFVSDVAGEVQPLFYYRTQLGNKMKLFAMNTVIAMLNEAGIYQRWLDYNTYGWRGKEKPEVALAEYSQLEMSTLMGIGFICVAKIFIAALVLVFELLVSLRQKRRLVRAVERHRFTQRRRLQSFIMQSHVDVINSHVLIQI